jgi:hypothetical protein
MGLVAMNMIWCHWPKNWLRGHRCSPFAKPPPWMVGLHFSIGCLTVD